MQITKKQMKTFNRINEKLRTIPRFFITNYGYLVRKYSYLKKSQLIVKCQLKLRKQRVVLLFNQLKKLGLNKKDDKEGKKQYSKKSQKKCHLRKRPGTVPRSSLQISKGSTGSRAVEKTKADKKVSTVPNQSKALSSAESVTVSKAIQRKNSSDNVKAVEAMESPTAKRNEEENAITSTEDVNEQIREQLKLLQSGRRSSISLLPSNGSSTRASSVVGTKTSSCSSTPSYSRHASHSSLESEPVKSTDGKSSKSKSATGSSQSISNQKPKFIDSLISKLKTQGLTLPPITNDEIQSLSSHTSPEKSTPIAPHKSFTECESSLDMTNDDDQLSDHSSSSKNDFLGFKEVEAQFERPKFPGMLPTPVVKPSKSVKSAFVSEELDNFMKENALDNSAYRTAPLKKRHDEAMMYAEAQPPSLLCPQLPSDVEKPRTVAEKRQLLEQKADIKYLMIENESTVYRELRKRAKAGPVPNYTLIRNIQQMNIPFTRDCWRAACWLNTPNGRFYYQTIQDNGKEIKVLGGRGNNSIKELVKIKPMNKKKFIRQDCTKSCRLIGNIKINGLDDFITESAATQHSEPSFTAKKLNTLSDGYSFRKPGPLSLKKLNPIKSSIDVELGPLELFDLPRIQLQVWPKLDRPLPEAVHPYLKLALPYQKITPEWAEFALSTLKQTTPPPSRRKRKRTTETADINRSYTFNIPYTNNQNRILVRKRRQIFPAKLAKLNSINETEKTQLNFMKDVDKTDDVAVAVADVLTDMINSVALTLCEATVVKDDPDIDYGKVDALIGSGDSKSGAGINPVDGKKTNTLAGKVVKELKKLNAKIIHGFDTIKREDCKNDFCELGCICDSLRGAQTYSYHCKEVNCMFECECPSSKINTSTFQSAVHNSDIKQYCDRMNASLAKEEKDFTATVVVSDGKTIYVPTWDEKKKRLKKVPKRMSDYVQFESDFVHRDLSETLKIQQDKHTREKMVDTVAVDDRALMTNKNDIVKNMIHVNVNVERLNVLDDLQAWCMVHCLYKCFCKYKAVEGRRFEFGNAKIAEIEQPIYTKKRQYTFERSKDEPAPKYINPTHSPIDDDYSSCRRVRVVATNNHKIVNRARSEDIRRRIKKIETDHPGLKILLRNRIKRSIALPEVGPLVTLSDSRRRDTSRMSNRGGDSSRISNENQSTAEVNGSGLSNTTENSAGNVNMSSSLPANDLSIPDDATSNKYRSRFNNIIMKTMQGISQKLKTTNALPSPANKAFFCMQWKHFLQAFNADRICIHEVRMTTEEVLLVVTDNHTTLNVSNAVSVMNIKAIMTERLPLLPKLIKLGVINAETEKMSILLFGISNYWRVLGATHSENDFMNKRVVAVPTPDSNPRLASKISSLFDDMVKLTLKNRPKELSPTSNVCIRQLDVADLDNIHVPIPVVGCHRWLMLSLANDFSHIYVPAWKQFISHEKILAAIEHAKKSQKTVRLGPSNRKPQVYAPHNSDMKIFFGPMQKNETLDMQLLQQSDGKMLLREDYQRFTNQQYKALTIGTWLYMKDDHMVVGDNDLTNTQRRTYPPKLKYFAKVSSPTEPGQGFIPLKPSTVTSNNLNITLMSPTASEGFSNCTTSTPSSSTPSTSSGNVPSSELIRHLSLGLRARTVNKSYAETSPIKVVDTKLLMSPEFIAAFDSNTPTSSNTNTRPNKRDQFITTSIQSKPITLSFAPNMQSDTDWKDVSKAVPIRKRRFTTIVSTDKPMLKSILQTPIIDKPLTAATIPAPTLQQNNATVPVVIPNKIRERRYTTIVSNGRKEMLKNFPQNFRRPVNVKNFELVQSAENKLTLAPIPLAEPPTKLIVNRPVIIKKIDRTDTEPAQSTSLRQRSKTIDPTNPPPQLCRPPSNKQTDVKPVTLTNVSKSISGSVVVVKPSSFNLNMPPKVSTASIASDGKSIVLKKLPALRPMPSIMKLLGTGKNTRQITDTTEVIDSDDDTSQLPPKKPRTSSNFGSAETNNTVNGYVVSQILGLGKFMAKRLFAAYSVSLPGGSKIFPTFKHCTDYLNNVYIKQHIFAMVPAHLVVEWKFVANDEDHDTYNLHAEKTLRMSMVLTKDGLIDLNSNFDTNEKFSMDLRHHLLVLRLAHACMKNFEARHKTGLEIVRKSEAVIKELKADNEKLISQKTALGIEKTLNVLKLNELKKKNAASRVKPSGPLLLQEVKSEIITIDSDDD